MNQLFQQFGLAATGAPPISSILSTLALSFFLGLIIAFIYKRTHSGFSYSSSFTFTLVMINVIVSVIMMVIGSNIALSLGLIGSLSIIRFRTVVKDTKDMAYLFWVIAAGLAVGAGAFLTGVLSVVFIGLMVFVLNRFKFSQLINTDYVMVLAVSPKGGLKVEEKVGGLLAKNQIEAQLRSSLVDLDLNLKEITYAMQYRGKKEVFESLVDKIRKIKGVKKISLLTPETNLFV